MEQFKPQLPVKLSGNIAENWWRWEQRFLLYMTATGTEEKDLFHTIGEEELEFYNSHDRL